MEMESSKLKRLVISAVKWEYEDEIPEMGDLDFDAIFPASRVIGMEHGGVRMYPYVEDSAGNRVWISSLPNSRITGAIASGALESSNHDTPRTNVIAHRGYNESAYIAKMTDLARQLERELADAISERDALRKTADKLDEDKECNARLCETLRADWEAERALADRLAETMRQIADGCNDAWDRDEATVALAAWKEARR
jgi:hypothetical protein